MQSTVSKSHDLRITMFFSAVQSHGKRFAFQENADTENHVAAFLLKTVLSFLPVQVS